MANPSGIGGFRKGQSGNPGGRPRGFREQLRADFGQNGETFSRLLHDFLHGKILFKTRRVLPTGEVIEDELPPSEKGWLDALKWGGEMGFGKAAQAIDVTNTSTSTSIALVIDPNKLSDAELQICEQISRKARGEMQGEPARAELPPARVEGGAGPTSAPDAARVIAGEPVHGSASRESGEK